MLFVLTNKDRFLQLAKELISTICKIKNVEVVTINQGGHAAFEEDLAQVFLENIMIYYLKTFS